MEQETKELRRVGLKVTHPRMRILQIFDEEGVQHLTAEDVYKKLLAHQEDIGLATVYRVLTQFEAAGIIVKHNFEGGQAVYELDRGKHHDHMIDVDSGKVIEFVSEEIERLQHEIAARHGYEIEDHSLVLYVRPKQKSRKSLSRRQVTCSGCCTFAGAFSLAVEQRRHKKAARWTPVRLRLLPYLPAAHANGSRLPRRFAR